MREDEALARSLVHVCSQAAPAHVLRPPPVAAVFGSVARQAAAEAGCGGAGVHAEEEEEDVGDVAGRESGLRRAGGDRERMDCSAMVCGEPVVGSTTHVAGARSGGLSALARHVPAAAAVEAAVQRWRMRVMKYKVRHFVAECQQRALT